MRTATAPHKQLQPAKLRDAPDGVYEGVGCARQQSEAARNDSRGVIVNSKLRPSSTKNSQNGKSISFHAREPSAMDTSPTKKRLSLKVCCSPGGCFNLFSRCGRNTYVTENYVAVRACTSLGPKKGKTGQKSSGFLFICIIFSETSKCGSWLQSLTLFSSHTYVAETPTCVCLTFSWVILGAIKHRWRGNSYVFQVVGVLLVAFVSQASFGLKNVTN